jgi:hypothetical protein
LPECDADRGGDARREYPGGAAQAPLRLDGEYTRDEAGQAADIREVLEIFDAVETNKV